MSDCVFLDDEGGVRVRPGRSLPRDERGGGAVSPGMFKRADSPRLSHNEHSCQGRVLTVQWKRRDRVSGPAKLGEGDAQAREKAREQPLGERARAHSLRFWTGIVRRLAAAGVSVVARMVEKERVKGDQGVGRGREAGGRDEEASRARASKGRGGGSWVPEGKSSNENGRHQRSSESVALDGEGRRARRKETQGGGRAGLAGDG